MHKPIRLLSVVFVFLTFGTAQADDQEIHDLFRKVWSPYCKGVSLQECSSGQAQDLRDELRHRVEKGETQDQILADLEAKYGERLRMMPDRGGRENLAWQIPWLFAALVIFSIAIFAWRRKRPIIAPTQIPMVDPKLQEKILNDLENRLS